MPTALLRSAEEKDFRAILAFAKKLDSYNLPFDRKVIRDLIRTSIRSFQGRLPRTKAKYLFVIEDPSSKEVFGTSLIIARQGRPHFPFVYLERRQERRWSRDLNKSVTNEYLKLGARKHGPTEVGGLFLKRRFRTKGEKFGKQLSWIRFLYMACHPERSENWVLVEFLPLLKKGKRSLFWDHMGRYFTGLSYAEADRLSITSKEFIFSLFPKGKLYTVLLPEEFRNLFGKVAPQAEPAREMLKRIGFRFTGKIDPFDGGPYDEAERRKIAVVRRTMRGHFQGAGKIQAPDFGAQALLLLERRGKVRGCVGLCQRKKGSVFLDGKTARLLRPRQGEEIFFTPFK